MGRGHWEPRDFVVTEERDDGDYKCRAGYCRVCTADMSQHWNPEQRRWDKPVHYNSHRIYKNNCVDRARGYRITITV